MQNGNFDDNIEGLDPTLSWSGSASAGNVVTLGCGLEAKVRPTKDLASLPKSLWGRCGSKLFGWGVSAKTTITGVDLSKIDVDVDVNNKEMGLDIHVGAVTGSGGASIKSIEGYKCFESNGSRIGLNPRYMFGTHEADFVWTYDDDNTGTGIEISSSTDAQSVTISQQLDDANRIAPTFTSDGDVSVEWECNIGENSFTTTLKPKESIDVEWKENSWTSNIHLPLEGSTLMGGNISIKKEVSF